MRKQNQESSFVGIFALKQKHNHQLQHFLQWAEEENWNEFHSNHYDWWMFPIDKISSYGHQWTVCNDDIEELKLNEDFMRNYKTGVELLATSWGWDLLKREPIIHAKPDQCWQQWPVRLYKAAYSTKLFGVKIIQLL